MRENLLSTFFGPEQFTGAEHTQTVSLLTTIGIISAVILIGIAISLIARHIAIVSLRLSARSRRRAMRLQGKRP